MSEFHDDYPQYEFMAHHSEEEGKYESLGKFYNAGKIKRRKLWNVFWIMLGITIFELIIGSYANKLGLLNPDRTSTVTLKILFIGLTLCKAGFIVLSFMHLGDEKKSMKYAILAPYMIFILYFVYIIVGEANYCKLNKEKMDGLIVKQKIELNEAAKKPHHEETEGSKEEAPKE